MIREEMNNKAKIIRESNVTKRAMPEAARFGLKFEISE